jgi:magnesium-transporting ATPase (P-type)
VDENSNIYGRNELSKKRLKSLFELFCQSLEDLMLRILIVSAIISIIVEAIYSEDRSTFWLEGVTILLAVAVCSIVASVNDYQKQKQFEELNEIAERNNKFDLIREGRLR